jgi:large subunit ribosomal protein L21
MKIAIIKTGGKQYCVAEKNKLKLEKLSGEAGSPVEFNEVLLLADGQEIKIGKPALTGTKVSGKILKQGRAVKVTVVKYKSKTRYKRTHGHRQNFTEVQIEKIA